MSHVKFPNLGSIVLFIYFNWEPPPPKKKNVIASVLRKKLNPKENPYSQHKS